MVATITGLKYLTLSRLHGIGFEIYMLRVPVNGEEGIAILYFTCTGEGVRQQIR